MSIQIAVRLPEQMVALLDRRGVFSSRVDEDDDAPACGLVSRPARRAIRMGAA